MRSTSIFLAFAAFTGMAASKRGCKHDETNPGWGWYWVVVGDSLNAIAADFNTTAVELAKTNNITNPDFLPAWVTIVVPCES
ncbi:uncharacterized protein ColSpa_07838 [Colletotrichum spaethianum]|uniref:LysM domain-containing protein n=1 Tax=Colletotrichum spaethianum TaxID=700344 RepID=A0AA37UPU1_9PEZI|nr:uncharacterized protein ColSpa_07838 [Colletotrichum spaethianum]GKT47657.1 hypothetical protein ColSpa_07838 [Colletotrichum spaethianum]